MGAAAKAPMSVPMDSCSMSGNGLCGRQGRTYHSNYQTFTDDGEFVGAVRVLFGEALQKVLHL